MEKLLRLSSKWTFTLLACGLLIPAHAELISNGGFESGFTGWTRADALGSDGSFAIQSGVVSPVNGDSVSPPSEGLQAAMSDAQGPGSHVLYQDFVVPAAVTDTLLSFDLFVGNRATDFFTPASATLDFGVPAFNQQARVDILRATADPFSVNPADVLQTLFQTSPGDPLVSGYTTHSADIGSLLAAHANESLRLRFAETDNVFTFQFGVDKVGTTSPIPEPSSLALLGSALAGLIPAWRLRRRSL
jgi:hypothetical protein